MSDFSAGAYRILVVDDDHFVLKIVSAALESAGFHVSTAASGEEALASIKRRGLPHLAIVDISMPLGMDGLEFCEVVHEFSDLPIVMLTAINEDKTIIDTIDRYAEDYITKPFSPGELVSRVRRVLRRIGDFAYALEPLTRVDDYLGVNFPEKSALVDDKEVPLTPTETKLLYILMRNAGRTVTTEFIARRLWPFEMGQEDRLRVYVHRLRRKIESEPKRPTYIISQRGIGYSFGAPVDHKKV